MKLSLIGNGSRLCSDDLQDCVLTLCWLSYTVSNGNSMIFFNAMGQNDKVQAIQVNCCIEEVERILNGD